MRGDAVSASWVLDVALGGTASAEAETGALNMDLFANNAIRPRVGAPRYFD
jgi:hypothetical protein